jgi:hypothetical protein
MVEFLQAHFVVLLGAIVCATLVWAVVSSLVPWGKQTVTLSGSSAENDDMSRARQTTPPRGYPS